MKASLPPENKGWYSQTVPSQNGRPVVGNKASERGPGPPSLAGRLVPGRNDAGPKVAVVRAYVRVSKVRGERGETKAQAEARIQSDSNYQRHSCRELAKLHARGLRIVDYTEVVSTLKTDRPERERMLADCNPGDIIVADSISRLQRNMTEALEFWNLCKRRGVTFYVREGGLTNSKDSPVSELVYNILSAVHKFERDGIRERLIEMQETARANGRPPGRKRKVTPAIAAQIQELRDQGLSIAKCAKAVGMREGTVKWYCWNDARNKDGRPLNHREKILADITAKKVDIFEPVDEPEAEAAYAF